MIPYLIKVALILSGCVVFYKLILRKETFYMMNRYVLIICLLLSFGLPFLPIPQQWALRRQQTSSITKPSPATGIKNLENSSQPAQETVQVPVENQNLQGTDGKLISFKELLRWAIILYWFGVGVFGARFLLQLVSLFRKAYLSPVIRDGRYRIVEVQGENAPCSFGNNIFINPEKYEWDTYNQILLHEKIHIRQKHSLDILAAELALIFQWFNPFAWIYRREMENNLEFLADDELVRRNQVEKTSYQLSLVKVSAPHFPLSLTTNYNQSILKKRIVMMNSKRSNLHTAWKYFFILPLLAFFACLLNEPRAIAQGDPKEKNKVKNENSNGIQTEGSWFAILKGDKIAIQFKNDEDDEHSFNSSSFQINELSNLPKESTGTFKISREAGTMELTGKFEGNNGMGHYKFIPNSEYRTYMATAIKEKLDDGDQMTFFFVDIKKGYVEMLKKEGYDGIEKDQLIPLAALKVDGPFIKSVKESGFKDVSTDNLVTLKALGIDQAYIQEIRSTGLKHLDIDNLITFKSQGIDKAYIEKVRKERSKVADKGEDDDEADDIVTFKSLDITGEFINSFKEVGYSNLSNEELITMKATGITPAFIKGFQAIGYKNLEVEELSAIKALGITPEFIKEFEAIGYKNIPFEDLTSLKSVGVTADYVKRMKEKGFNYDKLSKYIALKSIDE